MASPIQWTWAWANSRRQWRIGKPAGMLQSMGSQRVRPYWVTEPQQNQLHFSKIKKQNRSERHLWLSAGGELLHEHSWSQTGGVWDCGSQVQNTDFVGRDPNLLHHKSNKISNLKKGLANVLLEERERLLVSLFRLYLFMMNISEVNITDHLPWARSRHPWVSVPLGSHDHSIWIVHPSCFCSAFCCGPGPPALVWTWLWCGSWLLSLGVSYLHALQITPSIPARIGAIPCFWVGCLFLIYYFSKLYCVS